MPISDLSFLSSVAFEWIIGFVVLTVGILLLKRIKRINLFFRFIYNLVIGVDPGKHGENIK